MNRCGDFVIADGVWGRITERAACGPCLPPSLRAPENGKSGNETAHAGTEQRSRRPDCSLSQSAHDIRSASCYRVVRKQLVCTARLTQAVEYLFDGFGARRETPL